MTSRQAATSGAHQCFRVETRQAKVAIFEDIVEGNCQ